MHTVEAVMEGAPSISAAERQFGFSLRTIRQLGELSCSSAVDPAVLEGVREEAWCDFATGVQENVVISQQTEEDPDATIVRERLKFEPMRSFRIVDDEVITDSGQPLREMIQDGINEARRKAAEDWRMGSEVERSENDLAVFDIVSALCPGDLVAVACMEPLEAMDRDGDKFWSKVSQIGYTRGLAVAQVYYRTHDNRLLAGAYSIKKSSKRGFRTLLLHHGQDVPVDTPANEWIRHAIHRTDVTEEEARAFGPALNTEYQQIIGRQVDEISVTRLMEDNKALVRGYFDLYIEALARANHTNQNQAELRGLASALLAGDVSRFSSDERRSLIHVANSSRFTTDDALFMENVVRYACAEELWNILLGKNNQSEVVGAAQYAAVSAGGALPAEVVMQLHTRAADRVRTGAAAGRSGNGCAGSRFGISPEEQEALSGDNELGQQDIFGGALSKESGSESSESDAARCEYQHSGCYCCPYDSNGNPLSEPVVVTAQRRGYNGNTLAVCLRPGCGAALLTINTPGKKSRTVVLSRGGIYRMAQQRAEAAKAVTAQQGKHPDKEA
jgi:hypothetical protein